MAARILVALSAAASAAARVQAPAPTAGPELRLNACAPAQAASQQWTLTGTPADGTLSLTASRGAGAQPMCIDIEDFDTNPDATVYTFPCGQGSKLNENWAVTASAITSLQTPPTCLAAALAAAGARVTTAHCSASDPLQALTYSAATGLITLGSGAAQLCVDANAPYVPTPPWCAAQPQAGWPVCDPAQGLDARAADIVARLSVDDKIAALVTNTKPLASVGLPGYQWWSEGACMGKGGVMPAAAVAPPCRPARLRPHTPHPSHPPTPSACCLRPAQPPTAWGGLACTTPPRTLAPPTLPCPVRGLRGALGPAAAAARPAPPTHAPYTRTHTPPPHTPPPHENAVTTSCSFNRTLWGATGNLIGREARAYINAGLAGSTFWTPGERARRTFAAASVPASFTHPPPSLPLASPLPAQSSTLSGTRAGVRPLAPIQSALGRHLDTHLNQPLPHASRRKEH